MSTTGRDQANLPMDPLPIALRERVMAASLLARGVGETVPAVPAISADEAFERAADAFYCLLGTLSDQGWKTAALRGLDVQELVGHLTGVEHDTHRALAGDPAVADAEHVESTQGSAVRQADRSPPRPWTSGAARPTTRWSWCARPTVTGRLTVARAGSRYTASGFRSMTCSWSARSSCGCTTTTSAAPSACRRRSPTRRCCA